MKLFKRIDFIIQVILILGGILLVMISGFEFLFYPYFIVGAWQLISILIHLIFKDRYLPERGRKYCQLIVFWLIVIAIACYPFSLVIFLGFILLIGSPYLAIWYAVISYTENKMLEHKAFVHLK